MNYLDSLVLKNKVAELQMLNLQVGWIFGINIGTQNIRFMKVDGQKAGNERIIYTVGKIIIIYYLKLNIQRYYKNHINPISAIEISKNNKLIASAEEGQYPQIHIWDAKTRLNLLKFKGLHKFTVKFIKFINEDKFLLTASEN